MGPLFRLLPPATRWPTPLPGAGPARWLLLLFTACLLVGCSLQGSEGAPTPSVSEPPVLLSDLDVTTGQTIYVPAYSEIYYTSGGRTVDLAVTLSVHNTDFEHSIVLTSVKYYGTQGQLLQVHLAEPRSLGPLASTDFFVDANEQSGGLGTNFVVEWVAEQPVNEPIVEAIMLSTTSAQGISFTSPGRVVNQIALPAD